jgi:hypothetical protein
MASRQLSQYDVSLAFGTIPVANLIGADASTANVTSPGGTTQSLQAWMAALQAISVQSVVAGYINGFALSNDPTLPSSVVDIAPGFASDSLNATMINGTTFAKSTSAAWTAGTTASGMGVGLIIAPITWYHVFAIIVAGAFDVYFDTSLTATNAPAGTTAFRYIGSFLTDSSAHILPFTQIGQKVLWGQAHLDVTSGTAATETAVTITVPPGMVTFPILNMNVTTTSGGYANVFPGTSTFAEGRSGLGYGQVLTTTNTARQVSYSVSDAFTSVSLYTHGYINPHLAPVF